MIKVYLSALIFSVVSMQASEVPAANPLVVATSSLYEKILNSQKRSNSLV